MKRSLAPLHAAVHEIAAQFKRSPTIIIAAAFFFGFGILAKRYSLFEPSGTAALGLILFLALIVLVLNRKCQIRTAKILPLLLIVFLAGNLQDVSLTPPSAPNHIYNLVTPPQQAVIEGRLTACPSFNGEKSRLIIATSQIRLPDQTTKTAFGLILLSIPGKIDTGLMPGDKLLIRARLTKPRPYNNPGGLKYQDYLADQSIWVNGWIKSPDHITKIPADKTTGDMASLRYLPERVRRFLDKQIDTADLAPEISGVYKALLLGMRNEIPLPVLEQYKEAGIMHLLAISGMHIGMLALLISLMITWGLKRCEWLTKRYIVWKISAALTIIPLTIYALIAGFNPPVVRALIMAIGVISAIVVNRPHSIFINISLAALIILTIDSTCLFYPSFQLSFGAVVAIALIMPQVSGLFNREHRAEGPGRRFCTWLAAGFILSVAAIIGTMPLTIFHFNRVSSVSALSTLAATPLLCLWTLPVGFAAVVVSPLSASLSTLLLKIGSVGIIGTNYISKLISVFPFSNIWMPTPTIPEIILYYGLILSIILALRGKTGYRPVIIIGLLLVALQVSNVLTRNYRHFTQVTFLDVGQGSCTLIELPSGVDILVDGGGYGSARFDIGSRVIAPFLWHKKISHLQAIVVTHPHADHYNGLKFIIEHFSPSSLWINGQKEEDPQYHELLETARRKNISIKTPKPDEILFRNQQSLIKALDTRYESEEQKRDRNEMSLVIKVETDGGSFLLPGDIYQGQEILLTEQSENIDSDILLAPHHGSKTSGARSFLAGVSPQAIIVSTDGRTGGFPNRQLVDYCRQNFIRLLVTGKDGAIMARAEAGKKIGITTFIGNEIN